MPRLNPPALLTVGRVVCVRVTSRGHHPRLLPQGHLTVTLWNRWDTMPQREACCEWDICSVLIKHRQVFSFVGSIYLELIALVAIIRPPKISSKCNHTEFELTFILLQKAGYAQLLDRLALANRNAKYSPGKHLQSLRRMVGIPKVLRHNWAPIKFDVYSVY